MVIPLYHRGLGPDFSLPREQKHECASQQSSGEGQLDVVPVLLQAEDPPTQHISS